MVASQLVLWNKGGKNHIMLPIVSNPWMAGRIGDAIPTLVLFVVVIVINVLMKQHLTRMTQLEVGKNIMRCTCCTLQSLTISCSTTFYIYNVIHLVVPWHKSLDNVKISPSPVLLENCSGQEIALHFCVMGNRKNYTKNCKELHIPMWLR